MIELRRISKYYWTGTLTHQALSEVSISFRENEFVSILGPSGSGKTTLLNVLGGLDRFDEGDLLINGVSTREYNDRQWDAYRNLTVGFVFQSYNLIMHQSVVENVELALTISGVSRSERRRRAIQALEEVGLKDHVDKMPNQLSGGQMQRVAIARALVNNPDVLLADEPTGALDSVTGVQIMELLKKVAENRLVIMVTHNAELAETYSTRIVHLLDGKITDDSRPYREEHAEASTENKRKARMSFRTSLFLSFRNLQGKKGRTLLMSFAGSIGIIGIALVLALSAGVNGYVTNIQQKTMAQYPIQLTEYATDASTFKEDNSSEKASKKQGQIYADSQSISRSEAASMKKNDLAAFRKWLRQGNNPLVKHTENILYGYNIPFYVYSRDADGNVVWNDAQLSDIVPQLQAGSGSAYAMSEGNQQRRDSIDAMISGSSEGTENFSELVSNRDGSVGRTIKENYKKVYGSWPENSGEVLLVLDDNQSVPVEELYALGLIPADKARVIAEKALGNKKTSTSTSLGSYKDMIGHSFTLVTGREHTQKDGIELKITGVIAPKKDADNADIDTPIVYTRALTERLVKLTNTDVSKPTSISIYTANFHEKEQVVSELKAYNKKVSEKKQITYTDFAEIITDAMSSVINIITMVLIAIVAISLLVSCIMIAIITHISVMERTKEIGILRAMGASKRNVSQVFNAETLLIGVASGVLGVGLSMILSIPIGKVVSNAIEASINVHLPLMDAALLIGVSIIITVLAGLIPSRKAAKLDPVTALRSE